MEHFAIKCCGSSSSYKKEKQIHCIKQTVAKKIYRKLSEEKYKKGSRQSGAQGPEDRQPTALGKHPGK